MSFNERDIKMPVINAVLKHIKNLGVAKSVFGKSGSAWLLGPPGWANVTSLPQFAIWVTCRRLPAVNLRMTSIFLQLFGCWY